LSAKRPHENLDEQSLGIAEGEPGATEARIRSPEKTEANQEFSVCSEYGEYGVDERMHKA
jgi:hypothetical protein